MEVEKTLNWTLQHEADLKIYQSVHQELAKLRNEESWNSWRKRPDLTPHWDVVGNLNWAEKLSQISHSMFSGEEWSKILPQSFPFPEINKKTCFS